MNQQMICCVLWGLVAGYGMSKIIQIVCLLIGCVVLTEAIALEMGYNINMAKELIPIQRKFNQIWETNAILARAFVGGFLVSITLF